MSDQPHTPIFGAGNLILRRRPTQRIKPRCKRDGCGHPRSEHASTFAKDSNDYVYGKCTVWGCLCHACLDDVPDTVQISETVGELIDVTPERCRACGSPSSHVQLGPECLARCEENWRELERLRRVNMDPISKSS